MKINCPHCNKDNELDPHDCVHCEKSFKKFKFRKYLVPTSAVILASSVGGYQINDLFERSRYPLAVEFAIVDTCIGGSLNWVSKSWYKSKRDICLCAMKETTQDIDYRDYKSNYVDFVNRFKYNAKKC
ncbi:hypothetical protein [Photobacterium leiognathi]|uniref:hypothetical protein n=1 Tax=Photobacterium leiognathi TaxID=553611 RepID=UPI002981B8A9|nr:hypothetical protein [Photobacterium leiognathi]